MRLAESLLLSSFFAGCFAVLGMAATRTSSPAIVPPAESWKDRPAIDTSEADPSGPNFFRWEDSSSNVWLTVDETRRTVTVTTAGTSAGWRCQGFYATPDLEVVP